MYESKVKLIF